MPDWIAVIYKGVAVRLGRGSTVMIQRVCGYDTGGLLMGACGGLRRLMENSELCI
jgi:hypothetical protein